MIKSESQALEGYYLHVQSAGNLLTRQHAHRWSDAVLKTLGIVLDRSTKRALAKALPDELSESLTGVFWLLHFRDSQLSSHDFQQKAARRAGNTDPEFARLPTIAVFGGIRRFIHDGLAQRVSEALSPEVEALWREAAAIQEAS